jgi:transposase
MKRFIEAEDRTQLTLLPECLDDYIAEDNPVRVVEVFVNELDLGISASTAWILRRRAGRRITLRCC